MAHRLQKLQYFGPALRPSLLFLRLLNGLLLNELLLLFTSITASM